MNRRQCKRPGCRSRYDDLGPGKNAAPAGYCSTNCHRLDRAGDVDMRPARASTLKRSGQANPPRAVSPASPEQREVVRLTACIVTGRTKADGWQIDPAHLCPRGMGGCNDPLCVVPLWRPVHRAFDDRKFDLLKWVVFHGLHAQVAHALEHYRGDVVALTERLTSCRWQTTSEGHLLTLDQLEAMV